MTAAELYAYLDAIPADERACIEVMAGSGKDGYGWNYPIREAKRANEIVLVLAPNVHLVRK